MSTQCLTSASDVLETGRKGTLGLAFVMFQRETNIVYIDGWDYSCSPKASSQLLVPQSSTSWGSHLPKLTHTSGKLEKRGTEREWKHDLLWWVSIPPIAWFTHISMCNTNNRHIYFHKGNGNSSSHCELGASTWKHHPNLWEWRWNELKPPLEPLAIHPRYPHIC